VLNFQKYFSEKAKRLRASEIRELLKWIQGKKIISFGGGIPDPRSYPVKDIAEIAKDVILNYGYKALQYGTTEGQIELREELLKFMRERANVKVESIDNIIITTGSQQSLDLTARILIDPKDVVIVELPTYLVALYAFRDHEPMFYGIPMDDEGMRMDVLEETLKKLKSEGRRVKFVYTIPTCQNPAGVSMSIDRRKRLLELASEYDILIIEDDPYSYYVYEDVPIDRLKSMDSEGRVIYMSTFSKIASPGLRVGWVIGEREIIEKYVIAKQSVDLCTSPLAQYIALEVIRRKVIDKVVKTWTKKYKAKRDIMLKALEEYMPDGAKWTKPVGGFFIFLYLPKGLNTKEMLVKALDRGVAYVPGQSFFVDGSGENTIRLNFSYPKEEDIERGIKILADLIREELSKK